MAEEPTPNEEARVAKELAPDEKAFVEDIVQHNKRMMQPMPERPLGNPAVAPFRRAQHPKHHGCVRASFVVASDVPEELRHGVFAEPNRSFAALIRFSNGTAQDDREADAHGMAIKLLDVEGDRFKDMEWQTSQDFVLVDNELFFSRELAEYEKINRFIADGRESWVAKLLPKALAKSLARRKLDATTKRKGAFDEVVAFAGQQPSSPLASHYWSTTPYRLGAEVVKYMAVSSQAQETPTKEVGRNYLAEALARELERGASFDFMVHVRGDPEKQPIEDPRVSWSRNGARRVRLARIEIPAGRLVEPLPDLAERVVMSPWNCLQAHEPLGKINLARREVYEKLATERLGGYQNFRKGANGG